jgi:hypothetical protein
VEKVNQPEETTVINAFRDVLARPDEQMRRAWHLHVNNHWKRHRYRDAYRFTHKLTPLQPAQPQPPPAQPTLISLTE